ncbi:ATP-binding cassette, subfamily B, multidrug efflux pump [Phyllobacterium sp. CL33Tsu]|uniref:ABC transporter ATP-binding protein n=1 Tax=Phyllobacterium sp. CL33Tsu TaxID=1798191 RepID=UPI0008E11CF1|nr:ABC transporter ATP-binding protein [Phyllobacterium sp. CL33Tsu]SFJ35374.1 ATP-binding cassette, subfamily B, multidrug efflux pump [Phyllobacterium sp. CL33Tsu]
MTRLYRLFESWVDPYASAPAERVPNQSLAFMWFYVRQEKYVFLAMLVCGGLIALFEAGLFWFVGKIIDILASTDRAEGWQGVIDRHGVALLLMLLAVFLGRTLVLSLAALVEEQAIVPGFNNLVRWQAHSVVYRQSLAFFQNDFSGRIVTKVWAAGQALGDFMVTLLQAVWFSLVYCATTLFLIGRLDWRLASVVGVWLVVFGFTARYFLPRVRKAARDTAEMSSLVMGRLVDGYSNIQTLKLFGTTQRDDAYMRRGMDRWLVAIMSLTRGLSGIRISLASTSGAMICVVAALSIDLWLKGEISSGEVAFTLGLVLRLSMLLTRMMANLNGLLRNYGTIQNSMELLARPVSVVDKPGAQQLTVTDGAITFENVRFHYESARIVIDDFSLHVRPGEKIGLVGRSGAGKSTLVNLLLRFFDVESGRILIDGQDIANVTQDSLRAHIGMVTQDTSLLHRSVRDNILYGRPDASDDMMRDAVINAQAEAFIDTLTDPKGRRGLDAHVGERGVKLSGGQRQRIAIARVMLKDAPILILDEATSALDSEVEAAIQESLYRLMEGKTVIAIAHRLSTIAALDRLIVMDEGRIVESGTHAELVAANGLYAGLWARQSGGFIGQE